MSEYTTYDFEECLEGAGIPLTEIAEVVKAHGEQGDYAEWGGGFVLRLKDGVMAYVSGWCDTTGWG